MRFFKIALLICALLALAAACGCGKTKKQEIGKVAEVASGQKKVIGVTLLTSEHEFYRDLEEGLRQAADIAGFELRIVAGEWDLDRQHGQIEDFITSKMDAIVVCPVDSVGIGEAIKAANEAQIPVFTADIEAYEGDVVCHVASDNHMGGRLAGEYMIKLLGGKGKVAIIDQPLVASVIDRVDGFEAALANSEIEIVAKPNGEGRKDKAMSVSESLLQGRPEIVGVFGINDDSALGALEAAKGLGLTDLVIVGYDATPEARREIAAGGMLRADVIQHPKRIGSQTIKAIEKFFAGEDLPQKMSIEVGILDKEAIERGE